MFRKSTISDKYGWWMGQNFCHPAGNFRHLLRTGEKWCNDLLLGGEAPSKLRLRWRGSREVLSGDIEKKNERLDYEIRIDERNFRITYKTLDRTERSGSKWGKYQNEHNRWLSKHNLISMEAGENRWDSLFPIM